MRSKICRTGVFDGARENSALAIGLALALAAMNVGLI
jgi:hypothetical protein